MLPGTASQIRQDGLEFHLHFWSRRAVPDDLMLRRGRCGIRSFPFQAQSAFAVVVGAFASGLGCERAQFMALDEFPERSESGFRKSSALLAGCGSKLERGR